jgi:hypothetical protein
MPAKGIDQVRRNLNKIFSGIEKKKAPAAVNMALIVGGGIADVHTPQDTATLLNSRFRIVETKGTKIVGRYGYTAAYAAAVHSFSGKLKGQPRGNFGTTGNQSQFGPQQPRAFGGGTGQGNYWDPQGEPQWLTKAFEENKQEIERVVKENMRL